MGRPRSAFHRPGKRLRGRAWRVFWRGNGRTYELSLGPGNEARAEARRLEIELALRVGRWPAWAESLSAVQRFRSAGVATDPTDLLTVYEQSLRGEVSASWASTSLAVLRELVAVAGHPFGQISPADAEAYLSHVLTSPGPFLKKKGPRSRATRNRCLAACNRFYKWAVRTGRLHANPFAGVKLLKESDVEEILHLTRKERDAVLDAVAGDPDELAVWIALFGGMRRGEIARCRWRDISFDRGKIDVPRSKTRRRRAVDLATRLRERLAEVPEKRRRGRVIAWPAEDEAWHYRAREFLERLQARFLDDDGEPINGPDGKPIVAVEKLRWNVFRHTFASLLVQNGAPLWKVAQWMGNSIQVCQRHYAAMRPEHDADIDLMG